MKNILFCILGFIFAQNALATVDSNDRVFIVAQHVQSGEFFIERVPVIGCHGQAKGPQLVQFTAEYKAPSNIGCGMQASFDNINYLICAKVISEKENQDYSSFSEITLDISKCVAKNDKQFITMLRTAAKLNFSTKSKEVKLNLIK
ncbi:MAG: hypothetical protein ACOYOK_04590 [Pseudobdellovibrionaceae bacterium]